MLYSTNRTNFIAWLPLRLEILDNMYIVIVCFPVWDVINFEINLAFPVKPFSCMTKKVETTWEWKEFLR